MSVSESRWISRPWIDLIVGCGGWSAPLLLVSYLLVDGAARQWAAIFYGLALVCNYPHYMATLHRAYARRDDRAQHRAFTVGVTAVLVAIAVAAHVRLELLSWLFTAYIMWSPWHYSGQNYGILMMFLRRNRVDVSPAVRRALRLTFVASYVMLLAAFNAGTPADPLVHSLELPAVVAFPLQVLAGGAFLVVGLAALARLAGRAGLVALVAPMTLFATQALWFVVPIGLSWMASAPTPQARYSTGMLAVMHSAQYLWVTRYFARRDAVRRGEEARWSAGAYWATLVAGGIALFLPIPWLASYVARVDFTASMLIVIAVVNIHHFVIDGVVWKLRDPRVSQALVGGPGAAAAQAPAIAIVARDAWRAWLTRPAVRATAVALLAALALIDQWRYRLALRATDRQALETARGLNPHDSSVHLQLASAARQSGDVAGAEASIRTAMAASPQSPMPYHELLRLLIETGRDRQAYDHALAVLERWPGDVDTLVNAGVLAHRLGDRPSAERWWRRALEHDPSLGHVQLYLAELFDAAGRPGEAVTFYQRYLEQVVRLAAADRPAPQRVALIVVKFGDALAGSGQLDLARPQYALAARIALQSGLSDLQQLALDRLAAR